jgi:hypothetical protein
MGMRRADDHRMRRLCQADIVGKAASASEKPKVLLAPHRLPNTIRHGA